MCRYGIFDRPELKRIRCLSSRSIIKIYQKAYLVCTARINMTVTQYSLLTWQSKNVINGYSCIDVLGEQSQEENRLSVRTTCD